MADISGSRCCARLLGTIMAALLLLGACSSSDSDDEADESTPEETVGEFDDGDEAPDEPEAVAEPETVELDVDPITVGAFVITFTELEIVPNEFDDELYTVNLTFSAENELDEVLTPLNIGLDSIVLEAGSGFLTSAQVDADGVPGGRTGTGSISFTGAPEIDASEIPSGTLVFGTADQNQPSVTLDGSAAEPFMTIPIDVTVDGVSGVTQFQINGGSVVFRDNFGELLDEGRAILTMALVTSATPETGAPGEYIGPDRVALERPDGTSVAPEFLNRAVYPGDVVDEPLEFQLQAPIDGDYILTVGEDITVTFTVG